MTWPGAVPSAERTPWSWLRWRLAEVMGLDFPAQRVNDLKRSFAGAARAFGFEGDPTACIRWLATQPLTADQQQVLADHLTVPETYFYREAPALEVLRSTVLPDLVTARRGTSRRLHVWSAACCSGEEAYTLAMLLREAVPHPEGWDLRVLGTDLNTTWLDKARRGCYADWSFRDTPAWLTSRYFHRQADGLQCVNEDVRRLVRFEALNLMDLPRQPLPHAHVDVIACRNVLMYFTPDHARRVLGALRRCLPDDGWLMLSAAESSVAPRDLFVPVNVGAVTLFRPATAADLPMPAKAPRLRPSIDGDTLVLSPPISLSGSTTNVPPPAPLARPRANGPAPAHTSADAATRARRCADEGRWTEALASCERWIAADKLDPAGHYTLGVVLLEQGEQGAGSAGLDAARAALQRAVFLDHEFVLAHFALGNLAARRGRADAAARHYANARRALRRYRDDAVLPESRDLRAAQLADMLHAMEGAT